MASNIVDKPFSLKVPFRNSMITVDILPHYRGLRLVFRIITANLPELVIGLDSYDNWEELGGQDLISPALLNNIGDRIDQYLL